MINKYGLYNVNGENNEPIQNFKYSYDGILQSFTHVHVEIKMEID